MNGIGSVTVVTVSEKTKLIQLSSKIVNVFHIMEVNFRRSYVSSILCIKSCPFISISSHKIMNIISYAWQPFNATSDHCIMPWLLIINVGKQGEIYIYILKIVITNEGGRIMEGATQDCSQTREAFQYFF